MAVKPFDLNGNPIPPPQGPLSGEAHDTIDQFATITMNQNPDGRFPDGSTRQNAVMTQDQGVQPGAPAYQKGKPFKEGRC